MGERFDHMLVEPGWVKAVICDAAGRDGVRALFYGDGTVRIEHRCKVLEMDDGAHHLVTAPRLQLGSGHTIVQDEPLSIVASIACPDCGLHGYITDGRWVPC